MTEKKKTESILKKNKKYNEFFQDKIKLNFWLENTLYIYIF